MTFWLPIRSDLSQTSALPLAQDTTKNVGKTCTYKSFFEVVDRLSIVLVASEDLRNRDMNLRLIGEQRFKLISLIPSITCLFRYHKLNTVPYDV